MDRTYRSSGAGLTRRGFGTGAAAAGAGLILGTGAAPAIAQGKRELRYGIFAGDFGNMSPVIRWDIQAGIVMCNINDSLVDIDYEKRKFRFQRQQINMFYCFDEPAQEKLKSGFELLKEAPTKG